MFYGWKVVAAVFVMLSFSSALGFYNHSVMLNALSVERGFPVTMASTAVSVFFFASGIVGPGLAILIERFDVRYIMASGAVLAAVSLAMVGAVETEAQLILVYIVFGLGFAASGLLPATTLIARWFHERRALALSIASTGLSLGGMVLTPASAMLIDAVGMAGACPVLGFAYLIGVAPLALLIVRSDPREMGLAPDGKAFNQGADPSMDGIAYRNAVRMPYFWSLSIAYVFVMTAQVGGIAHQYGIVSEQLSGRAAALALSILPFFSIVGRLAGGLIVDRVSAWKFTLVMMLLQAASLLLMAAGPGVFALLAGLALFGVTVGNLLMLQPLLIAETFGLINYSRIYSVSNLMTMCGVAAGPVAMGLVLTIDGTYFLPYVFAGVAGAVAFLVFVTVQAPRVEVEPPRASGLP